MMDYFFCFFLSFTLSFLFWVLSFFLGKRSFFDEEKNSPFECGFDPNLSARLPFSMRFFLLAVLFLIFDVEIVLLMPVPLVLSFSSWESGVVLCVLFFMVLLVGLFHEWKEGSLNWVF
uniref:NADH-ubiquinone oxidoreductase chain 3 n=1 Tax=Paranemertes cf. peregrina SCS-2010 TaxID=743461 RepID=E7C1A3_9BILA|nr:NADH dehydrogenase subunit 3 [Paranemertes cf. peregrina SCS-2010]ADD62163.1 NADH dehydrogenase subunit 3 [Paranemertes cf. peregrina SCS-2010]